MQNSVLDILHSSIYSFAIHSDIQYKLQHIRRSKYAADGGQCRLPTIPIFSCQCGIIILCKLMCAKGLRSIFEEPTRNIHTLNKDYVHFVGAAVRVF
jgi:hypothetical protein